FTPARSDTAPRAAAARAPRPRRARHALAVLALARWPNALIAAGGVGVGAARVTRAPSAGVLLAALAAVALTVAANAWNDAADADVDRVAHPARPVPSGRIMVAEAQHIATGAALAGVALAAGARWELGALSCAVVAALRAYSPTLKRMGLAGNLAVALLASLPFLYGSSAAGSAGAGLALVAVAVPLHLARELAKDLADVAGDALANRRTLPRTAGPAAASLAIAVSSLAFAILFAKLVGSRVELAAPALAMVAVACALVSRHPAWGAAAFKLAMLAAMAGVVFLGPSA
ncbi:MAG: UbiA family prenyltransferase, partial [Gemmatimonadaceae bacterium]